MVAIEKWRGHTSIGDATHCVAFCEEMMDLMYALWSRVNPRSIWQFCEVSCASVIVRTAHASVCISTYNQDILGLLLCNTIIQVLQIHVPYGLFSIPNRCISRYKKQVKIQASPSISCSRAGNNSDTLRATFAVVFSFDTGSEYTAVSMLQYFDIRTPRLTFFFAWWCFALSARDTGRAGLVRYILL